MAFSLKRTNKNNLPAINQKTDNMLKSVSHVSCHKRTQDCKRQDKTRDMLLVTTEEKIVDEY